MPGDTLSVLSPAPPGTAAEQRAPPQITLPDHFSYSAMTTFQDCPRKWHYNYRAKAPREFVSASLLMGGAIHTALEQVNIAWVSGKILPKSEVHAAFDSHWLKEAAGQTVVFSKGEDLSSLRVLAVELLALYEKDCLPTLGDLIGVEEELGIKVPDLPVPVIGRLDMLVETPKALVVIDAKTSKGTFTAEKLAQATAQLALYGSALDPISRQFGKPITSRVIVFRKLKHAKIETIELNPTTADLRRVQLMLSETWGLIEAAHCSDSFPSRPSWMCRMCPFQGRCSQETGMSA